MRIFVNQTDDDKKYKTKFFSASALFAEEFNKYVGEEEKARIVLPFSFLLAKARILFPEGVQIPTPEGKEEKRFISLVKQKPELFEFHYTYQDEQLYKELYKSLFSVTKKLEAEHLAEESPKKKREKHRGAIDEAAVKSLRKAAFYVNKDFKWSGQNVDSWFADRGIANDAEFPALKAESSVGEPVGGIGLFRVLLERDDTKRLLGIDKRELPDVTPENKTFYTELFTKAADLVHRINNDIEIWQDQAATDRPVVKMKGAKKDKPKPTDGLLTKMVATATTNAEYLEEINQQWLEDNKIARVGQVLEMRGVSGAPLFQALIGNPTIREDLYIERPDGLTISGKEGTIKANEAIQITVDEAIKALALGPDMNKEVTLFAVDDRKLRRDINGEEIEGTDVDGITEFTKTRRNPLAQKDADGLAFLDVFKSGDLYKNFEKRLRKLAVGHPEREKSIETAIRSIKSIFEEKDHLSAVKIRSSYEEELAELVPDLVKKAPERDPEAARRVIAEIDEILEKDGTQLPSRLRQMLKAAASYAATLEPDPQRGGMKRAGGAGGED